MFILQGKTVYENDIARYKQHILDKHEEAENGCWNWTGSRYTVTDRPRMKVKKVWCTAARISYALFVDNIPESHVVHHKCGNHACVRPDHLQATTQTDNLAEMLERQSYLRKIAELEAKLKNCTCG